MDCLNKIKTFVFSLICALGIHTMEAKIHHWSNASLDTALQTDELKTMDNYLFFALAYNDVSAEWTCMYDGDYKRAEVKVGKMGFELRAAFTPALTRYSPCFDPKVPPGAIKMRFSVDSSSIVLEHCGRFIHFRRQKEFKTEFPNWTQYYLSSLVNGQYKQVLDSKDSFILSADSMSLDLSKDQVSNLLHSVYEFDPNSKCPLVYANILYLEKSFQVQIVFNQEVTLIDHYCHVLLFYNKQ